MKWSEWFEQNEDVSCCGYGSWKSLSKAERAAWKRNNPKPFRARMSNEEVLRLNSFVSKATNDIFEIECHQTGIAPVWIVRDIDTGEEYDFSDMTSW